MRWPLHGYASHALAALLLGATGCTLSADLDSLTSGGGAAPELGADGGDLSDGGSACSSKPCAREPGASPSDNTDHTPDVDDDGRTSTTAQTNATAEDTSGPRERDTSSEASESSSPIPPSSQGPTPFETGAPSGPSGEQSDDETDGQGDSSDSPNPTAAVTSTGANSSSGSIDDTDGTANLVHRYRFTDVATAIVDDVGDADGSVVGTAKQAEGRLEFDGETYVELPTDVLSGRENVTLEVWFTSYNTRTWERIFDIGQSSDGAGDSYLFFTSQASNANRTMRVTFRADGEAEVTVDSVLATSDNLETHVAVVFDGSENAVRLYHDGELSASATTEGSLQDVDVAKVWLGRSLFDGDPLFEGDINELRIYDGTLGAERVRRSFEAGPDVILP